MCMYITPCRQKILNNDGELGFNGPGNLSFARALWSEVPVAWHFKFGVLSSEIICNILASIFERSCSLYSGTARRAAPDQPILSAADAAKQRRDHRSSRAARQHSSSRRKQPPTTPQNEAEKYARTLQNQGFGGLREAPRGSLGAPGHPQNTE